MNAQSAEVYDFCNEIFFLPIETVTEFLGRGIQLLKILYLIVFMGSFYG